MPSFRTFIHFPMRLAERYSAYIAVTILSVISGGALAFGTRWGVGLSPDSAIYIGAARNLLSGHGLTVATYPGEYAPVTQYPPLFSTLLAAMGLLGVDPVHGVRWLNTALFGANVFLVGILVRSYGCSSLASLFASFLMMTSIISLKVHSMAWSEPLFVFLAFWAFFLLAKYLGHRRLFFLVSSSFAGALAALTRYAGIAVIATGVLAIFLWSKETWRKRSEEAVVFLLVSTVPLILWVVRNLAVADTAAAREIGFHPITVRHLEAALDSVASWLLPGAIPFAERASLLAVSILLILIFFLVQREKAQSRERPEQERLARTCPLLAIFVGLYALMLVSAISLLDAYMPIDNRYLYPIYVATLVLAVCLASHFFRVLGKTRPVRVCSVVLGLFFSGFYLVQGTSWLMFSHDHGIGYSSRSWRESKLIARVKEVEAHTPVFTNAPDAVYLLTGRPAYMLPRKVNAASGKLNGDYPNQLVAVRSALGNRNGVLVYFRSVTWRWYLPREEELEKELGLRAIAHEEDGSIYRLEVGSRKPAEG